MGKTQHLSADAAKNILQVAAAARAHDNQVDVVITRRSNDGFSRRAGAQFTLICVLIGLVLDQLVRRGRNGRWIAWMIVLLISFQGFFAWYEGVFDEIRPPVVSLTR